MVFWTIVLVVLAAVLVVAWRADRRRRVAITRRNGAVESAIGRATIEPGSRRIGGGGRS